MERYKSKLKNAPTLGNVLPCGRVWLVGWLVGCFACGLPNSCVRGLLKKTGRRNETILTTAIITHSFYFFFLTTHLHFACIVEAGGSHDSGGTCCLCLFFRPVASSICCSTCGQNVTTDSLSPATASLQKKNYLFHGPVLSLSPICDWNDCC
jgi:hypothetical protein